MPSQILITMDDLETAVPLNAALEAAIDSQRLPTDESQAVEWAGYQPRLVAGRADNLKVTTPEDLLLASAILAAREESQRG